MNINKTHKYAIVIIAIFIAVVLGCDVPNGETCNIKWKGTIVAMNMDPFGIRIGGKGQRTVSAVGIALVQSNVNKNQYVRVITGTTRRWKYEVVDDDWFYTHKIGDRVEFCDVSKDKIIYNTLVNAYENQN